MIDLYNASSKYIKEESPIIKFKYNPRNLQITKACCVINVFLRIENNQLK